MLKRLEYEEFESIPLDLYENGYQMWPSGYSSDYQDWNREARVQSQLCCAPVLVRIGKEAERLSIAEF
jgi:hypothetical protein